MKPSKKAAKSSPARRKPTASPPAAKGRAKKSGEEIWNFRLYVAGQTPKSLTAFTNLKALCEEHLQGRYEIEIVDLISEPHRAQQDQILALPTLVRKLPEPIKRVIGDLSNQDRVKVGLDLKPLTAKIS